MESESSANASRGKVVILGDFLHEGVKATIVGLGYELLKRTLYERKPKTWKKRIETIRQLSASGELAGVILYLPTPLFLYGCHDDFAEVWRELVTELSRHRSIVFVFEDNLAGEFGYWDYETGQLLDYEQTEAEYQGLDSCNWDLDSAEGRKTERKATRLAFALERMEHARNIPSKIDRFLETLLTSEAQIAPFRVRDDVTIRIQEFLRHIDEGLFLRLYVPHGRYQSEQLDSFLRVFESYLRRVEGINFSIDSSKTKHGVVYTFKSADAFADIQSFGNALDRFDEFMNLCRYEPNQAEGVLQNIGVDSTEAAHIVAKYSKDYQRVVMDTRHELEYKKLVLRQRLESEVFELASDSLLPMPPSEQISPLISLSSNVGPITINLSQVSAQDNAAIQSIVGEVVQGDIVYTEEDGQLIELFNEYASRLEAIQLKSDLEQLKDQSAPQNVRLTAKQRIMGFLRKTAHVVGDAAVKIAVPKLIAYLNDLISGAPWS